jgi:hypothetical protein
MTVLCRSCRGPLVDLVLDLGLQPAADSFPLVDDETDDLLFGLQLWVCGACGLAQLGEAAPLPPEPVLAVESATSRQHAAASVQEILSRSPLRDGSTVREVASHHGGSWLPYLQRAGLTLAGPGEPADLLVDVHALAHEEDLDATMGARAAALAGTGRFVLEFHHVLPLLEQGQFDAVRHGHPVYLSLTALVPALARHGLRAVAARSSSAYGGSLQVTSVLDDREPDPSVARVLTAEDEARVTDPARLGQLGDAARDVSARLRDYLEDSRSQGRLVLGYGAPSRAAVLLCLSGVDAGLLPFTADLAPGKHGRRVPGCRVPIRSPEELLEARPDDVLILAWDLAAEVAEQLQHVRSWGGRFIVPLPQLSEYLPGTGLRPL